MRVTSWKEAFELYKEVGRLPGVLTREERVLMVDTEGRLGCHCRRNELPRATMDAILAIGQKCLDWRVINHGR
jgi:hypothetical protein